MAQRSGPSPATIGRIWKRFDVTSLADYLTTIRPPETETNHPTT